MGCVLEAWDKARELITDHLLKSLVYFTLYSLYWTVVSNLGDFKPHKGALKGVSWIHIISSIIFQLVDTKNVAIIV